MARLGRIRRTDRIEDEDLVSIFFNTDRAGGTRPGESVRFLGCGTSWRIGTVIGPGALRARPLECEVASARAFHSDREGMNGVSSITRNEFLQLPGVIDGMARLQAHSNHQNERALIGRSSSSRDRDRTRFQRVKPRRAWPCDGPARPSIRRRPTPRRDNSSRCFDTSLG
jgi:hypothetical protein